MCALEETLLQPVDFEQVYPEYEALLFGLEEVATFRLPEGEIFMGIIKGVAANGRLIIATESGEKAFRLKEVEMLY